MITAFVLLSSAARSQCTSQPPLMQEDTQNVVIYYHADQGNLGLLNLPSSTPVYAHSGVITNLSTSGSDWKYAPTWGDNSEKYRMEYVSPNLYRLNIGDIRTFYGITNASEVVKKLAFVFRTGDNTKEGKGENGTDIFLEVLPDGLQSLLLSSHSGNVIDANDPTVSFNYYCTDPGELTLTVNGNRIATASGTTELTGSYTFTETGNYTVTGTAKVGSETVSSSLSYVVPKQSPQADYPGGVPKMGAVRNGDGSVTFCLAAPEKFSAMIVGNWNDYTVSDDYTMSYQDYQGVRYFWITVPDLAKGENHIYYYIVDGEKSVGDPYARLVLDPYNDRYISAEVYPDMPQYPFDKVSTVPLAVFNDNLNEYDWQVKDFKGVPSSQLFIYELLLRDFTGTEGKAEGNGTVRKAMEKIPYLRQMGVNAVELLPVNEFNGNISWGYNPNFYFAPDKAYGTPDDYKAFIDECHRNGMAVILDVVFNQSDWLHPWYQLYPAGKNPFFNATAPHAYSVLNDWNQGYPLVQQQWKDVLRYWLTEYNVDGFRFDLVKGLGNNDSYPNSGDSGTNQYNQSRINNMRALQQAMEEVKPGAYFINENLAGASEENEMAKTGQLNWANINHQGMQYAEGYESDSSLKRFYAPDDARTWGSTVSYLESHDEQRLAYAVGQYGATGVKGRLQPTCARLGSAAAQMMMAPGAHMVWMFSELANAENTKNPTGGNNVDPKTVRWNYLDNQYRKGLYTTYSELGWLRAKNPEMFTQDVTVTNNTGANAWSGGRTIVLTKGDKQFILAVNPNTSGDPINVNAAFLGTDDGDYKIFSKTYGTEPTFSARYGYITVPANSYAIVGSSTLTGIHEITVPGTGESTDFGVWTEPGRIFVTGAPAGLTLYTLSGMAVSSYPAGGNLTIEAASGIYILRGGNSARKIIVK